MKKVKAYKPNKRHIESQDLPVITSKLTDVKCELLTKQLSHYLLKDLPSEFLVCNTNLWNLHPVKPMSITGCNGNYTELAESEKGPQIAVHGNCVATQFYVTKSNPETVTLLHNFINHHIAKIYNNENTVAKPALSENYSSSKPAADNYRQIGESFVGAEIKFATRGETT